MSKISATGCWLEDLPGVCMRVCMCVFVCRFFGKDAMCTSQLDVLMCVRVYVLPMAGYTVWRMP